MVRRYRARLSGPLLDRIDLHVEVPAVAIEDLRSGVQGESSEAVANRVLAARALQTTRLDADRTNASLSTSEIEAHCALNGECEAMLTAAFDRLGLSARALQRVLRVARTNADLGGRERVSRSDLAEAIQYRSLDRRVVF